MTIEEIKSKITSLLSDACETYHYDAIEKLSAAYNNLCQAQKSEMVPTVEYTKDGIKSTYSMPTVDRFNNETKKIMGYSTTVSATDFDSVYGRSIRSIPAKKGEKDAVVTR